jgi:HAD superfamily hydrolase (TIGR01509 family)
MQAEGVDAPDTRGVLWDLDGTLVDSAELHWISWRDTLAAEGHEITHQQFLASFGQKNDRILPVWLGPTASAARMARIGDDKEAAYRRLARERGLTPLPGAADWVRRLRASGWKQAIASSAPRANVDVMLEALGLADCFDALVGAEDVTAGKPDPQVFLVAAAKLGLARERCIIVEDAAVGIEAARRAGIRSIGVSPTGGLHADVTVASLADLPPDAFERLVPLGGHPRV